MSNVNIQESMSMPMISGNLQQCQCQYQCFPLSPIQYQCQCQYFFNPLINANVNVNFSIYTSMSISMSMFCHVLEEQSLQNNEAHIDSTAPFIALTWYWIFRPVLLQKMDKLAVFSLNCKTLTLTIKRINVNTNVNVPKIGKSMSISMSIF